MLAILKRYTKIDPQAFAQMGFMAGKFATQALLNVKGPVLEVNNILYVTAPDNDWPIDRHDGHEIWHYSWKPRAR